MKPSERLLKIALIILFGLILGSCEKDPGDAPSLPPEESMIIDFSNFESGAKSAEIVTAPAEYNNWGFAALVAGYFRTMLTITLAIPVFSFEHAFSEVPEYTGDKTWQWSYSVALLNITFKARLTGHIRTNDILWEMYLAQEGTNGYPEFLWFKGTSNLTNTEGQWILNHSYQYQEPVLQIDWTKTGTNTGTVKYTYIRTLNDNRVADPFKGSYIEYGSATGTYDSYYAIHYFNGSAFSDVNVEWNSATHDGRVKCNAYFGDNLWHCWNNNLVNINCP